MKAEFSFKNTIFQGNIKEALPNMIHIIIYYMLSHKVSTELINNQDKWFHSKKFAQIKHKKSLHESAEGANKLEKSVERKTTERDCRY